MAALRLALSVLLRLFAPVLPYATEEVWSWWREGSVHQAAWPAAVELETAGHGDPLVLDVVAAVLSEVRKVKALQKLSLKAEVDRVVVHDTRDRLAALEQAEADLREAGNIGKLEMVRTIQTGPITPSSISCLAFWVILR